MIAIWYLVGILSCLMGCYFISDEITLKDLVAALFAGLIGPIIILILLFAYITVTLQDADVVLVRRKKKK